MSYELDIKEIERQVYMSYSEDGLVDIAIGVVMATWGTMLLMEPSGLIGLIALLGMGIWYFGKRFITVPRAGVIKPGLKMERRMRNLTILLLVLGLLALVGILMSRILGSSFSADHPLGILGLVIASGVCLLAYLLNTVRLYAYAVILFIAFVGGEILAGTITTFDAFAISVIIAGVVILLSGLFILIRFLRRYPRTELES
ncbi:MAG: hypothetical protein JSV42_02015 [Chloroflexota bacterium]|nr:MAG: hypothetical protein JSV42_02015 [Chloroflexota bacterium]